MNRGRRRENIFLSRNDYETFIKVLQETSEEWNLKISAYCLMSNHYHLLVHTPDGNISRCMRHINGVYTQRFNRYHKKDGQLFRGRYKAVLVDADSHLLEVLRYIHRNPLRAGISKELNDFAWSSHPGYISKAKKWEWLHKDFLLSMLSGKKSRRRSAYIDFVSQVEPEEIERFYSLKNLSSVLGSDYFKEWVKEKFSHLQFHEEIPESRELAPSPEKIIALVCDHFKVTKEQIAISRRGTENLPRDVAIYLVRHHSRGTLATVGRHFAIGNYSTVSSVVERIKARKNKDRSLQKHLEKIGRKLAKSPRHA
jgi:REP element-mobilizing transposase RayT